MSRRFSGPFALEAMKTILQSSADTVANSLELQAETHRQVAEREQLRTESRELVEREPTKRGKRK